MFDVDIRQPGQLFLHSTPHPNAKQWQKAEYWRRALGDLHRAYGGICAYCAEWIPHGTGEASVDHFIPKSVVPGSAYEWGNFRLAARRYNIAKLDHSDVVDPFTLQADRFILDFPSLLIGQGSQLEDSDLLLVRQTIARLLLNDERSIMSRHRWVRDYCQDQFGFDYLKRNAPFIAYELERQGLVTTIKRFFGG